MSKQTGAPRRLRIRPRCSIDGVRFDENGTPRRLMSGLYVTGKNLSEREALCLSSEKFRHAVEILKDKPEPEALADDAPLPQPDPGDVYRAQKRREAEKAREELWERQHQITLPSKGKEMITYRKPEFVERENLEDDFTRLVDVTLQAARQKDPNSSYEFVLAAVAKANPTLYEIHSRRVAGSPGIQVPTSFHPRTVRTSKKSRTCSSANRKT